MKNYKRHWNIKINGVAVFMIASVVGMVLISIFLILNPTPFCNSGYHIVEVKGDSWMCEKN